MTPSISLTKTPDAKARAAIEEGLSRYSEEQAGYSDSRGAEFCEVLRRFVTAGEREPGRESGRDRSPVFQ